MRGLHNHTQKGAYVRKRKRTMRDYKSSDLIWISIACACEPSSCHARYSKVDFESLTIQTLQVCHPLQILASNAQAFRNLIAVGFFFENFETGKTNMAKISGMLRADDLRFLPLNSFILNFSSSFSLCGIRPWETVDPMA